MEIDNKEQEETQFERLLKIRDWYKRNDPKCRNNDSATQRKMGVGQGFFSTGVRNGYKIVRGSTFRKIEEADNDINTEWIRTGIGTMFKHPYLALSVEATGESVPYHSSDILTDRAWMQTIVSGDPDYLISYKPFNGKGNLWCEITGESMSPTINGGDKICLSPIESIDRIMHGSIYAVITTSGAKTVRRIIGSTVEGCLRLVPDNKDGRFGDYQDIRYEEVERVYKVLGSIRSF